MPDAGVFTTLTMTAALGVNDGEIGAVIQRALATPYVGGVTIQPVFGSGRSAGIDPDDRLTHTGVLARGRGAAVLPADLAPVRHGGAVRFRRAVDHGPRPVPRSGLVIRRLIAGAVGP
ncbi:MAG: hypothetical protein QM622_07670 [Microbacterium sp.]